jgi:hypothetical protein
MNNTTALRYTEEDILIMLLIEERNEGKIARKVENGRK